MALPLARINLPSSLNDSATPVSHSLLTYGPAAQAIPPLTCPWVAAQRTVVRYISRGERVILPPLAHQFPATVAAHCSSRFSVSEPMSVVGGPLLPPFFQIAASGVCSSITAFTVGPSDKPPSSQ